MASNLYERYGMNPELNNEGLQYHCTGYTDILNKVIMRGIPTNDLDKRAEKRLKIMAEISPRSDYKGVSGE